MQIKILKPGLLSTIQDLGRTQFLADAVPVSGAMDVLSARLANLVLGNTENAAVIEFTYHGAEFLAETDLLIALSGEGSILYTEDQELPADRPIFIPSGTRLFLKKNDGSFSYLAVAGGWKVPEVLGSKSTYLQGGFGGFEGRRLREKDVLKNTDSLSAESNAILKSLKGSASVSFPPWKAAKNDFLPLERKTIRVIPGREFTWFTADTLLDLLSKTFTVSPRCNRMAYELEGPPIIRLNTQELLSTVVTSGTIQATGDGKLMMLMADSQVTGGYPRILQVIAVDLPLCAQLKPRDEIYFEILGRKQAEKLYIEQELNIRQLAATIRTKY
ncbi:biotin-dependent carboxyltransferase family protein [Desertivirga xinjiangensis]|uniref:5-oxoprolinase subunit C family protein n=1 Tax=Desertivirga xinjiangensis TaxID=539206 RepID=UPI002109DE13|nr:biotin-dependent carboxyltransferase family protein [Pedobacter xinjiangensis]